MKEKPITFNGQMAQAIAEGRKTQTRRVMKPQPDADKMRWNGAYWEMHMGYPLGHDVPVGEYSIGERLFVQEPFVCYQEVVHHPHGGLNERTFSEILDGKVEYLGDYLGDITEDIEEFKKHLKMMIGRACEAVLVEDDCWQPPEAMTQKQARSIIEITAMRAERVQDITEADARAEGISDGGCLNCGNSEPCKCGNPQPDARDGFAYIWHQLFGDDPVKGLHANPWVWVYEFKTLEVKHE